MKRVALLSALLAGTVLISACGTASASPSAATSSPSGSGSVVQPNAAGATEVDVTLADNTIQSSLTSFKVGVPYRFVIINNGNHLHDFNISTPVDKAGSLDAALNTALLTVPQDKLPIGGGTSVDFTFPASAAGQTLEFSCLIRRHYEDGMRLAISVTQ